MNWLSKWIFCQMKTLKEQTFFQDYLNR